MNFVLYKLEVRASMSSCYLVLEMHMVGTPHIWDYSFEVPVYCDHGVTK